MTQASNDKKVRPARTIWPLFFGCLLLILFMSAFRWFDTTTVLVPSHPAVDRICLWIGVVCGMLCFGAAIYLRKGLNLVQRIVLPLILMFEGGFGVFMGADQAAGMVEERLDFPAGKTHTTQVLFPIARAYQTHGKGGGSHIQTMYFWSGLDISRGDFAFMQSHRRPGDDGHDPDEISSKGYFCAKVTIEQTDKAARILHAGSRELPQGTVALCPVQARVP
jgi:hypothetical protein